MKILKLFVTIALTSISMSSLALDGKEIMKRALEVTYYQGADQTANVHMSIVDQQGRQRIREMTMLRKNSELNSGQQKYYVYFSKPADVKKMVFMVWKNIDRDDDRWLYLPALDLVKRIAASDERSSFVGSNYLYEDISGRGVDEDTHQLLSQDDRFYLVNSVPIKTGSVEFQRYQMWVDKKSFLPMKIEYYNAKDTVYRSYQVLNHDIIDGFATVTSAQLDDFRSGGKTKVDYTDVRYSRGLPEKIFSERYLRKAPKKYLK